MPARPSNRRAHEAALLLGDLNWIERPPSDPLREPSKLAQRVSDTREAVRMLLDEILGAELAACLLVAR